MGAIPIVIARHFLTVQSVAGFLCSESIADQDYGHKKHGDIKCFYHHRVMRKEKNLGYL